MCLDMSTPIFRTKTIYSMILRFPTFTRNKSTHQFQCAFEIQWTSNFMHFPQSTGSGTHWPTPRMKAMTMHLDTSTWTEVSTF